MMDRRSFLAKAPLVAATASLAGVSIAAGGEPYPAWLIEWREFRKDWADEFTRGDEDTPASVALWGRIEGIEEKLAQTQAQTLDGIRAQISWFYENMGMVEDVPHCQVPTSVLRTLSGPSLAAEVA